MDFSKAHASSKGRQVSAVYSRMLREYAAEFYDVEPSRNPIGTHSYLTCSCIDSVRGDTTGIVGPMASSV